MAGPNKLLLLSMLAMAKSEVELVDDCIKSLKELREELVIGKPSRDIIKPFAEVAALMLKFEMGDKTPGEVFDMVQKKSKIAATAAEFHEMTDFNDKENSNKSPEKED